MIADDSDSYCYKYENFTHLKYANQFKTLQREQYYMGQYDNSSIFIFIIVSLAFYTHKSYGFKVTRPSSHEHTIWLCLLCNFPS